MEWAHYTVLAVFTILGAGCIGLVAVNLPGTWIMIALAALIELLDGFYRPDPEPTTFGWGMIAIAVGASLFGELIEFIAGAIGTKFGGGTRRGMIGAILGGFIGAVILTLAIPIPLLGTLIGALIGTFAGAMLGEMTAEIRRSAHQSLRPAIMATIGRVLGTVAKVAIAFVVWIGLLAAAIHHSM